MDNASYIFHNNFISLHFNHESSISLSVVSSASISHILKVILHHFRKTPIFQSFIFLTHLFLKKKFYLLENSYSYLHLIQS